MKLAVIGGGSTYTPELIDGVLTRRGRLPISHIHLHDINHQRLEIVGKFAERMANAAGGGISITWGNDLRNAIRDTNFVVSQFRIGTQAARDRDEKLGREFNLVGQETVGVGGFAKALRTIPVALNLAQIISEESPNAMLLNFTNPAGLITEALLRHMPQVKTIGLCNVPWNIKTEIANTLKVPFTEIEMDYVGLNHLSWVRGAKISGIDRSSDVIQGFRGLTVKSGGQDAEPYWSPEAIDKIKAIPNYYLLYYYETQAWINFQKTAATRASEVMKIEADLLIKYGDENLKSKPDELMLRGGAYYSDSAAELMADIASDAGKVHVVNTRNNGAIPDFPDDVVMELPSLITKDGAKALPSSAMRPDIKVLVDGVKNFELLTIQAAQSGDEATAIRALVSNPLGPKADIAKDVWARLKEVNRGLLGRFDV